MTLPGEVDTDEINYDHSFVLYPGSIKHKLVRAAKGKGRKSKIFLAFDRDELIKAAGSGKVELTVVGKLKTGT